MWELWHEALHLRICCIRECQKRPLIAGSHNMTAAASSSCQGSRERKLDNSREFVGYDQQVSFHCLQNSSELQNYPFGPPLARTQTTGAFHSLSLARKVDYNEHLGRMLCRTNVQRLCTPYQRRDCLQRRPAFLRPSLPHSVS